MHKRSLYKIVKKILSANLIEIIFLLSLKWAEKNILLARCLKNIVFVEKYNVATTSIAPPPLYVKWMFPYEAFAIPWLARTGSTSN